MRDKIIDLIHEAEIDNGVSLSPETTEFLVHAVEDFSKRSIIKFVRGVKEHGEGFLTDVDMLEEASMEVMDQWMFIKGAIHKQRQYDARLRLNEKMI